MYEIEDIGKYKLRRRMKVKWKEDNTVETLDIDENSNIGLRGHKGKILKYYPGHLPVLGKRNNISFPLFIFATSVMFLSHLPIKKGRIISLLAVCWCICLSPFSFQHFFHNCDRYSAQIFCTQAYLICYPFSQLSYGA